MTTYVLCHGAWSGGWMWRRVADILRASGHRVYTPTYTGLGERVHLLNPEVGLDTHIQDIRNVIHYERLDDFVLVGHSYGGKVVSGAADQEWQKIRRLVYVDAFLPEDGQTTDAMTDGSRARSSQEAADKYGDGWKVPRLENSVPPDLPEEDRKMINDLSTMQPLKCSTDAISLDGNHLRIREKAYVLCSANIGSPFHAFAEKLQGNKDWQLYDLPTHHYPMLSMPQETADAITG